MKQIISVLSVLVLLWLCGCQSRETEAYLQNLAEENATLLELIQLKNQELDQLTAQLQQQDTVLASRPMHTAAPMKEKTMPLANKATAGKIAAPPVSKQTDSLQLTQTKIVVASGYPTTPGKQATSAEPISDQKQAPSAQLTADPPTNVEQFLNQLSDPAIALATRKAWKKAMLLTFAHGSVEVFAEKKGFVNRYTAEALLDLLVYFPHQVTVSQVVKDPQDKIVQLRIQMNRPA
jgi:uncharacterized membrane protein